MPKANYNEYNPLEGASPVPNTQPTPEFGTYTPPTTATPVNGTPMPKPPLDGSGATPMPKPNPIMYPNDPPTPQPPQPTSGNTGIVPPNYAAGAPYGYQAGQTLADYTANAGTGGVPPAQYGSGQVISDFMNNFTNPNSAYIQQARRAGQEQSNSRGGLNGSLSAGASQREAIKAAQPLVSEAANLLRSREGYAAQNWINSQQFDREFNGSLALLPITNSMNIMQSLAEMAATNPEIYTPEIISGYSNFFAQNMQDILSQYFGIGG